MKKNIAVILLVLSAAIVVCLCWSRFCARGRYQVVFGDVQKTYRLFLTLQESGEKHAKTQEEVKTVPVCIKIDTVTGQTWVYKYSFWVGGNGSIHESEGFIEISR